MASPYPKRYETLWKLRDCRTVLLRPIKPEDEQLWLEMFRSFSEESIHYRFFQIIKDTPHEVRVRYCNIDYDRELAIVAELTENEHKKILGVVRLSLEPDRKSGEIAFIIADPWQGLELGNKNGETHDRNMQRHESRNNIRDNAPRQLQSNQPPKEIGFTLKHLEDGTVKATLNLKKEKQASKTRNKEASKYRKRN